MLELLTCARGHFWEQSNGDDAIARACPECGAPPETLPRFDFEPDTALAPLPPPQPPMVLPLFDGSGRPVLAGYEILEDLGRTAQGVHLYRAKQAIVNRQVLLKVVVAHEDAGQRAWGCLRGEASALGKLSHPNILHIHEAGERDRQLFFNAIELVNGPTLAQKVAVKSLPFGQITRLMEVLARAMHQVHLQGLLHRHLQPSSILLQADLAAEDAPPVGDPLGGSCMLHSARWIPRIVDFGLTRRPVEGDPTDVDLFGDQPGFLSPEQAWGRARDIGPQTDVYGLGGILYFLLTGRAPFRGPTLSDVLDAIQTARLVSPSDHRSVPADLDAICRKCLARLPRQRYSSAAALADDLRRTELSLPLACRPSNAAVRFGKWIARRPAVAGLLLVVLLALGGTVAGYFVGLSDREGAGEDRGRAWSEPARARHEISRLQTRIAELREEEQFAGYRQMLEWATRELNRNNREQARALLQHCPQRYRGVEWYYLHEETLSRGQTTLKGDEDIRDIAFSPRDSRLLAVASSLPGKVPGTRRGLVRLWDVSAGKESLKLDDFVGPIHALCFLPDDQALATAGGDGEDTNGQVRLWTLADGPLRGMQLWSSGFPGNRTTGIAFSPTGNTLVAASAGGLLMPLTPAGKQLQRAFGQDLPIARTMKTRLRMSPDGSQLASFTEGESLVRLWHPSNHRPIRALPEPGHILDIAFSRDWLAIATSDHTIHLHDLSRGVRTIQLGPLPQPVLRLAFSPDGSRLAGACKNGPLRIWTIIGVEGIEVLTLPGMGTHGLTFSASGKALASAAARNVIVWGQRGE